MISVVMATYNGEKYIREQLNSILSELEEDDEVVISDDHSSDRTIQIIESIQDSRIKIFINPGQAGVNKNFENALKMASGDIIFFSDQDDIWLPGKVEACKEALKDCDCVFHDALVIDAQGNTLKNSFYNNRLPSGNFWRNLWKTSYMSCRMAINRNTLKYVLPYPKKLYCYQEGWVGSMIALKSKVKFIDFKGIKYRRHTCNVSCTSEKSPFSFRKKISFRTNLLLNVSKRFLELS